MTSVFDDLKEYFQALGDTVPPDPILRMQLRKAKSFIRSYCNRQIWDEGDDRMRDAQLALAIQYCNTLGVEGQTSHSEGGVSRSFALLPEDLQAMLQSLRLVPMAQRPEGVQDAVALEE